MFICSFFQTLMNVSCEPITVVWALCVRTQWALSCVIPNISASAASHRTPTATVLVRLFGPGFTHLLSIKPLKPKFLSDGTKSYPISVLGLVCVSLWVLDVMKTTAIKSRAKSNSFSSPCPAAGRCHEIVAMP